MKLSDKVDPEVRQELERLDRIGQGVAHRQFKVQPKVNEIPEGGFVLAVDAGVFSIYTKISGKRYKAVLTLDP